MGMSTGGARAGSGTGAVQGGSGKEALTVAEASETSHVPPPQHPLLHGVWALPSAFSNPGVEDYS